MRYLFGDSTESNIERNYLELLENFVGTSIETIGLDNEILVLKGHIDNRNKLKKCVFDNMANFTSLIDKTISNSSIERKDDDMFVQCSERSKELLTVSIDNCKAKFADEISQEILPYQGKISEIEDKNKKMLEPFLIQDPIPIISKKYTIKAIKDDYSAKVQINCTGNISYIFSVASSDISFWDSHVRVSDFVRGLKISIGMKKSFLKKDLVPNFINFDDYLLSDAEFSEEGIEAIFRESLDTALGQIRLKVNLINDVPIEVYYTEEDGLERNIVDIPELRDSLNIPGLNMLEKGIVDQANDFYFKRRSLLEIYLDNIDVIKEGQIFELMLKIADIYTPILMEIKSHSPHNEELSLKIEDDGGKRTEIYVKKSHIREKLSVLNEKGDKLSNKLLLNN